MRCEFFLAVGAREKAAIVLMGIDIDDVCAGQGRFSEVQIPTIPVVCLETGWRFLKHLDELRLNHTYDYGYPKSCHGQTQDDVDDVVHRIPIELLSDCGHSDKVTGANDAHEHAHDAAAEQDLHDVVHEIFARHLVAREEGDVDG